MDHDDHETQIYSRRDYSQLFGEKNQSTAEKVAKIANDHSHFINSKILKLPEYIYKFNRKSIKTSEDEEKIKLENIENGENVFFLSKNLK